MRRGGPGSAPRRLTRFGGTPPHWVRTCRTWPGCFDPFHFVKLALTCVDEVRRRVQQDTLGHRGFAGDPLFRTRRLLRRRADRLSHRQRARIAAALDAGDPHDEITTAWLIAKQIMAAYANPDRVAGRTAAERAITAARGCPVPQINRLGRTLNNWRPEYLSRFDQPQVSNGPTENLNLKIKNTKRTARGYRSFRNYRLRLLLNHGLIRQDQQTTRVRTRRPSASLRRTTLTPSSMLLRWHCRSCHTQSRQRRPRRHQ